MCTAKRVCAVYKFGQYTLTIAKGVEGLHRFGESVLSTVKQVGGFQRFGKSVLTCNRLSELCRVRFGHRKACKKLAEVRRVRLCFLPRKAHRRLAEVWGTSFDHQA